MTGWKMTMIEPTLDDLLDDDIMQPIMRSAGTNAAELKARLGETARRLVEQEIVLPPPAARLACRMHMSACSH